MKFEIKKCLSLPIVMLLAIVGCTSSDINNNIPVNSNDLIDTNVVYKSETVKVEVTAAVTYTESVGTDGVSALSETSSEVSIVNINTASAEELMSLNGIGEKTAEAIIEYRKNTPFEKPEDIMNVKGIGEKKYENIKNSICV